MTPDHNRRADDMKMKWERIGIIAASIVSIGTVLVGFSAASVFWAKHKELPARVENVEKAQQTLDVAFTAHCAAQEQYQQDLMSFLHGLDRKLDRSLKERRDE